MFIQLNDIKVIVDQLALRLLWQEGSNRYFPMHHSFHLPLVGTIPFTLSDSLVHAVEITEHGILSDIRIKISAHSAAMRFEGALDVQMAMSVDVDTAKIKFKTDLVSIQWTENPIIDVGGLNIQVERLSSHFISHYGTEICSQLADQLEDTVENYLGDFTQFVKPHLENTSSVFQVHSISAIPDSCYQYPGLMELKIHGRVDLNMRGQAEPERSGKEQNPVRNCISTGYFELEPFILEGIQEADLPFSQHIESIKIRHSEDLLILDLLSTHRLLPGVRVQFKPELDKPNQLIELKDIQITTQGKSMKSRLLAPVVRLWVKKRLRRTNLLNLEKLLEEAQNVSKNISTQQIEIKIEESKIVSLNFAEYGMECYFDVAIQIRLHGIIPSSI